jgi:hypothetical protein
MKSGNINDLKAKPFNHQATLKLGSRNLQWASQLRSSLVQRKRKNSRSLNKGMKARHHTKIEIESILQSGRIYHKVLLKE